MNTRLTPRRRSRSARIRALGWLAVVSSLALALLAPASVQAGESHPLVAPIPHEGNITTCPQGYATIVIDGGVTSGSAGGVTVNVTYSAVGGNSTASVAFTASGGLVWIAYIKGGDAYNEYNYVALGGVSSDSGLVSPLVGTDNTPNVSHSVFCVKAAEATATPTTPPTTPPTTEPTATPTATTPPTAEPTAEPTTPPTAEPTATEPTATEPGEGSVAGETGTPRVTLPPTSAIDGGSTPNTDSWRFVLVGFAAIMAGMLVLTPGDRKVRNRR